MAMDEAQMQSMYGVHATVIMWEQCVFLWDSAMFQIRDLMNYMVSV